MLLIIHGFFGSRDGPTVIGTAALPELAEDAAADPSRTGVACGEAAGVAAVADRPSGAVPEAIASAICCCFAARLWLLAARG